ncbi:MAG: DUF2760 domain-containing protein [Gammaproteobacteria bacterium]
MEINLAIPHSLTLDVVHIALLLVIGVLVVLVLVLARRKPKDEALIQASTSPRSDLEAPKPIATAEQSDAKQPTTEQATTEQPAAALRELSPDAALQLLGLLQQEARFIDFLNEDLTGYSDADIGGVARVVHEGGKRVLSSYFVLEPIRSEAEEACVNVKSGFDAQAVRLIGNVKGEPPYHGVLTHRGWCVREVKLPQLALGHRTEIIAPAEVEL